MSKGKPKFYRFSTGTFIEADTFEAAKTKYLARVEAESEQPEGWHPCTCLGMRHRHKCPEMEGVITF